MVKNKPCLVELNAKSTQDTWRLSCLQKVQPLHQCGLGSDGQRRPSGQSLTHECSLSIILVGQVVFGLLLFLLKRLNGTTRPFYLQGQQ